MKFGDSATSWTTQHFLSFQGTHDSTENTKTNTKKVKEFKCRLQGK